MYFSRPGFFAGPMRYVIVTFVRPIFFLLFWITKGVLESGHPQKQNTTENSAAAYRFRGDLVPELLHELVLLLAFGDQAAQLISHFSLEAHDEALVVPYKMNVTRMTRRHCFLVTFEDEDEELSQDYSHRDFLPRLR